MHQRLVYIDQLKGFAILMVVMGHVLQFCFKEVEPSLTSQVIVSFHMPLFAFLSGLVFTTICDFKQIVRKYAKQSHKLLLPFLSFLLIYAYTIRPEENMIAHPFKLGLWYLLFLWQCYLFTHLYDVLFLKKVVDRNKRLCLFIDAVWLVCTYLGFKIAFSYLPQNAAGALGVIHLYKLYPFFFTGCLIKRNSLFSMLFGGRKAYSDISFILWIFLLVISIKVYSSQTIVLILGALSVYPIVLWFYRMGGVNTKIRRMLNLFGRYSLDIYILHRFMTSTCDLEMFGKYIFETGSITIEILMALCLSLLFAYISAYISRFIRLNKILSIILLGDKK